MLIDIIIGLGTAIAAVGGWEFFKPIINRRKHQAESSQAELSAESTAIQNMKLSTNEWKDIANKREEEGVKLYSRLEKTYDILRKEQQAHLDTMKQLKEAEVKIEFLEGRKCYKPKCADRTPPSNIEF